MHASLNRGTLTRGLAAAMVALCVTFGAAGTAAASTSKAGCKGPGISASKVSIQLWTFAEYVGFGTDAAAQARAEEVLRRLRDMGYRNVEPFSLNGLTATQYRALLDKYGLKARSRHVGVGTPTAPQNIDQIIADNKILGIEYFGSGSTPNLATEAEWIAYARYLNEVGARAREAGQKLIVHNHNWEFTRVFGSRTAFDILMEYTDPQNVVFQLDLYWAAFAGADPVALLNRYGKRIELFHVKDLRGSDRRIEIVGSGVLDFPSIFGAGKAKLYTVEHDPRFGDATFNPFEAARAGFNYLDDVRICKNKHKGHGEDKDKDKGHSQGKGKGHDKAKGKGHHKGKGKGHDKDGH